VSRDRVVALHASIGERRTALAAVDAALRRRARGQQAAESLSPAAQHRQSGPN
jgi:hypothetical protein